MIFKTTSHRSREKLDRALGRHPQFSWTFKEGGCFVVLDDPEDIQKAKGIKGITKCRDQKSETYMKCISWK